MGIRVLSLYGISRTMRKEHSRQGREPARMCHVITLRLGPNLSDSRVQTVIAALSACART